MFLILFRFRCKHQTSIVHSRRKSLHRIDIMHRQNIASVNTDHSPIQRSRPYVFLLISRCQQRPAAEAVGAPMPVDDVYWIIRRQWACMYKWLDEKNAASITVVSRQRRANSARQYSWS